MAGSPIEYFRDNSSNRAKDTNQDDAFTSKTGAKEWGAGRWASFFSGPGGRFRNNNSGTCPVNRAHRLSLAAASVSLQVHTPCGPEVAGNPLFLRCRSTSTVTQLFRWADSRMTPKHCQSAPGEALGPGLALPTASPTGHQHRSTTPREPATQWQAGGRWPPVPRSNQRSAL